MGICTSGLNREEIETHIITPSHSNNNFVSSENTNTNTSSGHNQSITSSPPSAEHAIIKRCNYDKHNPNLKMVTIELIALKEPFLFPFIFSPNSETNITITNINPLYNKDNKHNNYNNNLYSNHYGNKRISLHEKTAQNNGCNNFTLKLTNNPPIQSYTNGKQFSLKHKNQGHLIVFPNYDIYNEDIFNIMNYTLKIQLSGINFNQIPVEPIESIKLINEEELIVLYLINQVRNNPQKFANEFLNKNEYKELFDCLNNYTPVGSLHEKKQLRQISMSLIDNMGGVLNMNQNGNDENIFGNIIRKNVKKKEIYFGVNIHYGKENGYSILLDMLNDNCLKYTKNRFNILNESFNQVGVCIKKNVFLKYCCAIVFGKDLVEL